MLAWLSHSIRKSTTSDSSNLDASDYELMRISNQNVHWDFARTLTLSMLIIAPPMVHGVLVNRTIDDLLGDSVTGKQPVFFPDGGWALGSQCTGCNIHPGLVDLELAFDGTWHDTTHHPGGANQVITATFSGSAVYVFNIIANVVNFTTTLTNLSFTLDSELVHNYVHQPDPSSPQILYNVPVYSNASLPDGPHTIEIRPTGPNSVLILFDYIAYTVEETLASANPSTSPTPSITLPATTSASTSSPTTAQSVRRPIGPVIGGVIAGVVVTLGLVMGALYFRRHQKGQKHQDPGDTNNRAAEDMCSIPVLGHPPAYTPESPAVVLAPFESSRQTRLQARVEFPHGLLPLPNPTPPTTSQHSQRHAALTQRLHALESQINESQSDPAGPETRSSSGHGSTNGTTRFSTGSNGFRSLQQELAGLRDEMAEIRALLEHERQLSNEVMEIYSRNRAVAYRAVPGPLP
ncbi:hypothetical protein C2E23DRAFT_818108 [Lenzites betulinus]|nr:hypothetical protein C2E23DRAFT_818108 [Lenzites betulinus]